MKRSRLRHYTGAAACMYNITIILCGRPEAAAVLYTYRYLIILRVQYINTFNIKIHET